MLPLDLIALASQFFVKESANKESAIELSAQYVFPVLSRDCLQFAKNRPSCLGNCQVFQSCVVARQKPLWFNQINFSGLFHDS